MGRRCFGCSDGHSSRKQPRARRPSGRTTLTISSFAAARCWIPARRCADERDIGIRNAAIAAVEPEIAAARGTQVLDATGQLVLPGLVDFHAHVLPGGGIGLSGDELVPYTGTTTYVSAGDAGVGSFAAFKHFGIAQSRTRILAFLHISSIGLSGFPVGEMLNIDHARVDAAAKMLAENPDVLLGIKVRETLDVVGNNGLEPLKRAIAAAERSGVEGARVMCHIGNAPGNLSELLDLLRPGDVLTHAYSGAGNNTVVNGKVLDAALAAKRRGVYVVRERILLSSGARGRGSTRRSTCSPRTASRA